MAKRNTIFKKGRFYHIYNRGANRNRIFLEKENYLFLLKKLKEYSIKYSVSVLDILPSAQPLSFSFTSKF
jgi:hypothetical protein